MSGFFLVFGVFLFSCSAHAEKFADFVQGPVSVQKPDLSPDSFPDRLSHWVLTHSGHLIPGTELCLDAEEIRLRCRTPEGRTAEFRAKRDTVLAILVYPPVDPQQTEARLRNILGTKRLAELWKTSRQAPDFDGPIGNIAALLPPGLPRSQPENGKTDSFDEKAEKEADGKSDTLLFLNGDHLDGRIMSIDRGFLRLQPENWQEFILVPLRRVRTIRLSEPSLEQSTQIP